MRTLEKGLTHHHTPCWAIKMRKAIREQAKNDKENAQVFAKHFSKLFNNKSPLPCDLSALDLIKQSQEFNHHEDTITPGDVRAALKHMVTRKAAGPSGITSDALKSMVWREEGLEDEADELANTNAGYLASVIHSLLLDF